MKKVKVDEKSKFLTAVLLVIVLIGAAFFLGYRKFEDKANMLNAQNNDLRSRIASLETYYLTEEQNKADTEKMTNLISDIFANYPGDARFEDGIYEAFNLYGGSLNTLTLESIGFNNATAVKVIPAETVTAAQIEDYTDQINFNEFNVSYRGSLTYEGLKNMVREIAAGDYNLAIGRMQYEITGSGYISGTTLLSFYSVDGAGCDYEEPPVLDYATGIENLFGVDGSVIETPEDED